MCIGCVWNMPDYGQTIEIHGVLPSETVCHRYLYRIKSMWGHSYFEIWVRAFVYVSISLLIMTRESASVNLACHFKPLDL